ncbi:MAG: hypothetical protein V1494_05735 [Candidatus Diapherotrites archaeon]
MAEIQALKKSLPQPNKRFERVKLGIYLFNTLRKGIGGVWL